MFKQALCKEVMVTLPESFMGIDMMTGWEHFSIRFFFWLSEGMTLKGHGLCSLERDFESRNCLALSNIYYSLQLKVGQTERI